MAWTAEQTGHFLDYPVETEHRFYGLFHIIALRGLRRGEACTLAWSDVNWDARALAVTEQLGQDSWEIIQGRAAPAARLASRNLPPPAN
ncbi:hypothetical protein [Kitasatospora sp. NBC_00315]|uniref:hypothetical protein n=1 Tax=Kitasatospora sp. NBC_00315 TaxID=2975963 RepID=UPI00324B9272